MLVKGPVITSDQNELRVGFVSSTAMSEQPF